VFEICEGFFYIDSGLWNQNNKTFLSLLNIFVDERIGSFLIFLLYFFLLSLMLSPTSLLYLIVFPQSLAPNVSVQFHPKNKQIRMYSAVHVKQQLAC